MKIFPTRIKNKTDIYKLMIGSITPRPIAFVSTKSKDGIYNVAPYSFFTGVSVDPPAIGFTPIVTARGKTRDSRNNIEENKEFVVNIVSEEFVTKMNDCAVDVPASVDEFNISGLTPCLSEILDVPRVKEAKVSMECKLLHFLTVSDKPMGGTFIIGEVLCFHVNDEIVDNYRINEKLLQTVGRMGGDNYCRTNDIFELERPDLLETMKKLK